MMAQLPALWLLALSLAAPASAILVVDDRPALGGVLYAVGLALGVSAEWLLHRMEPTHRVLESVHLGFAVRSGLRDLSLLVLVAVWARPDTDLVVAVTMAVVLVAVARVSVAALVNTSARLRDQPVSWRNMQVPGVVRVVPVNLGWLGLSSGVAWSTAPVGVGVVAALFGAPTAAVWVTAAAGVLIAAVLLVTAAVDFARARRDTPTEQTIEQLRAALSDYAPEVVFYYSRPEPIGYIANVWMRPLEALERRVLVVVREPHNEPLVETESLPVLRITPAAYLERVLPPSVRLALYPSNVAKNNHLIRLPGIVDVFVGHGDSDKGGSATVLTRIFDEVWVSGPAARDRYRVADVGVRDEQIHEVGRPQLAEISRAAAPTGSGIRVTARAAATAPSTVVSVSGDSADGGGADGACTVLYAPTREGFYSEWDYSSVLTQGAVILRRLLGLPDVRVLFKPHPGTGTDNPDYLVALRVLTVMVERAGAPHEVVTGAEGLYDAFNRADLLVSDVSSVITDFLASGKPYIVTNFSTETPDEFRRTYPSAAGAYVLGGDGGEVVSFVADARTVDSLRAVREQTARYLLGDVSQDPQQRFADAVTAAINRATATAL